MSRCLRGWLAHWAPTAALVACAQAGGPWAHVGGDAARGGVRCGLVEPGGAAWTLSQTAGGDAIVFVGASPPIVMDGRVFARAHVSGEPVVVAADARTGAFAWMTPTPDSSGGFLESWASLAGDAANGLVLVGVGSALYALDAETGTVGWTTALQRSVVNAHPVVTDDLGAADRVFITDFDGFGFEGRLYCVNVDAFDAALNPHQPGDVVWSVAIGGTSGNTPAYADGVVYVASVGEAGFVPGELFAFDATADAPTELWRFSLGVAGVGVEGFFGGVSVRDGAVYAATYDFFGGQDAGTLVKLDASDGSLVWSAACNRTSSMPIALDDGRVVVSGGLDGFGSLPSVQVFDDLGSSAVMLWDSALDSWVDDGDGIVEAGEYVRMGGWTHQPVAFDSSAGMRLVVGAIAAGGQASGVQGELRVVDLGAQPGDAGFVVGDLVGGGGSAAVGYGFVYSVGAGGLTAFGPTFDRDLDRDGVVDVEDLYMRRFVEPCRWDVNGDGVYDGGDDLEIRRGMPTQRDLGVRP